MQLYQEAIQTFRELFAEAQASGEPEPSAMTLATVGADGRVSARIVLLKNVDERGFVFYTNYASAKAAQLAAHGNAALCFLWKGLRFGVQVRVQGAIEKTSEAESDAYFSSRPRDSQIGAWASLQSQTLPERAQLDQRVLDVERQYAGRDVPRPPHWGGYRVLPDLIEIWYGQRARLHDRVRFDAHGGTWTKRLLYP